MLLEFGARNFFSFKEGFCFSLELNGNCPKQFSKGRNIANVIGIKGANASGKTNVLKALAFIKFLCVESFVALKPKSKIPVKRFFKNEENVSLFCRFKLPSKDDVYFYEVELNENEIVSEELSFDDSEKIIFKRTGTSFVEGSHRDLLPLKLRNNTSVINSAFMSEIPMITSYYKFFENIIANVGDAGFEEFRFNRSEICKLYQSVPEIFSQIKNILRDFDLGLSDVDIRSQENDKGEIEYYPIFIHEVCGEKYDVPFRYESNGTRKLFFDLSLYVTTLANGGVLVFDELDSCLHTDILPKLLELFDNDEINPHGAQFVFATHDTAVMDYLGKYRTYLTNKKDNASFIYRLDEIPGDILRNDRPISVPYRNKKIGGVPELI